MANWYQGEELVFGVLALVFAKLKVVRENAFFAKLMSVVGEEEVAKGKEIEKGKVFETEER